MKAIRYSAYGGPDVLEYLDLDDPVPAASEALIAVHCASVIPGDWKVRSGQLQEMFPIELPTIPGRDGSGTVIETGSKCDWAKVGDEICFLTDHAELGSYAELVTRPQEMTIPKPKNINFAEAAAMMHAGVCAWIGLVETAGVTNGQNVLIHAGAGAIGGLAIQIARAAGCNVTTTCSAKNADYVRSLGAHHVIAYDQENFEEMVFEQDVVFDLIGGDAHEKSCKVLRSGGTLVWLIARPFEDVSTHYGVTCLQAVVHDRRETLKSLAERVSEGILRPQVSCRLPLEEATKAHTMLERGHNSRGRIILDIETCM